MIDKWLTYCEIGYKTNIPIFRLRFAYDNNKAEFGKNSKLEKRMTGYGKVNKVRLFNQKGVDKLIELETKRVKRSNKK